MYNYIYICIYPSFFWGPFQSQSVSFGPNRGDLCRSASLCPASGPSGFSWLWRKAYVHITCVLWNFRRYIYIHIYMYSQRYVCHIFAGILSFWSFSWLHFRVFDLFGSAGTMLLCAFRRSSEELSSGWDSRGLGLGLGQKSFNSCDAHDLLSRDFMKSLNSPNVS